MAPAGLGAWKHRVSGQDPLVSVSAPPRFRVQGTGAENVSHGCSEPPRLLLPACLFHASGGFPPAKFLWLKRVKVHSTGFLDASGSEEPK